MKHKTIVLGIGNKARQGKDTFAKFALDILENHGINTEIHHFADYLYKEVSRHDKNNPLIIMTDKYFFFKQFPMQYKNNKYLKFDRKEFPKLEKEFIHRNISEYSHMKEKDPIILQTWGTDFRRKIDENYWVNKLKKASRINWHINKMIDGLILIPDMRFKNEYNEFKLLNKLYSGFNFYFIRMIRIKNGIQYIDPNRDPKHPSEIDLDDIEADFTVKANDGDLKSIKNLANKILKKIGAI